MSTLGKIERLPREVRDELNRRLDNNEPGGPLLEWLNGRREVKSVLKEQFEGAAITKQNLSEWRNGGFAIWQFRRDWVAEAEELAADAGEMARAIPGRLVDALATVLTGRYASVVHRWDGEVTEEFMQKLRALRMMCQDVTRLRQGEYSAAKLRIQEGWLEEAREKTEAEVVAKFEAWAKNKDVHDWLVQTWVSPKERERRKREMLGYPPLEETQGGNSNDQTSAVAKAMADRPKSKENSNSKIQEAAAVGVSPAESGQAVPSGGQATQKVAPVPPHPGPLPWGEGESPADAHEYNESSNRTVQGSPAESRHDHLEGGKSKIQNPKFKANPSSEVQESNPVRVGPAESGLNSSAAGPGAEPSAPAEEPLEMLAPDAPRHCKNGCKAFHPEGHCLRCFWTPGEVAYWDAQPPALQVDMPMKIAQRVWRLRQQEKNRLAGLEWERLDKLRAGLK